MFKRLFLSLPPLLAPKVVRPSFAGGAPALPATPARFVRYFVRHRLGWYGAILALEGAHATCNICLPFALSKVVAAVTAGADVASEELRSGLWLFALLSVGEVLFARAAGSCQITIGPLQRQSVTRHLYAYLQQHSHRYLSNNFAGALAHRVSETSMGVTQTIWTILFDFWPIGIVFSVAVALLARAHAELAWFVGGWAVCFVALSYSLAMRAQPYAHKAASARSETTGKVVDSITNLTAARLFARFDFERDYLEGALERELRAVRRSNWYSERVRWFQFVSAAVLKVGVLYYGLTLWRADEIAVGEFVMAVSLSFMIISEARNLSRRFLEFFEYVGNVANGVETIVQPHELVDTKTASEPVIERGGIELRDVEFGYTNDRKVFDRLTLSIPAGQRVGLVGSSGSGKSTLVSLVLRLFDPQSGSVSIDGIDVRTMTQDALHRQLSLIPQDPTLFHRTLAENIRYGKVGASDAEVRAAAEKAHAHEFIARMPDGYGAMVGERGVKLSGGQRQRIAIARVILKDAPILILDEATSSLDSITERAIQEALETVMRGKTVLVVAHRLSTIAHLDRILVFEHGCVVEDGTHAELLARRGAYFALWTRQADGFLGDANVAPEHARERRPDRVVKRSVPAEPELNPDDGRSRVARLVEG